MPRFAANLSMLFTESPFLERFKAAAQASFSAVEFMFPYEFSARDIAAALKDNGLELVLHNLPAGDWARGDRGMACHPDRIAEFRDGVGKAIALEAAAELAGRAGYRPLILGDSIEGEAAEVGRVMAGIARQVALHHEPASPPCVLISGGETTVTVRGRGRGGRNVEFLLGLTIELKGLPHAYALAGDTDGVDGAEEIAGAIVAPDTLARAAALGVNATARLADNDGHGFFGASGDQVITGPTLTNVNDFRAILIGA